MAYANISSPDGFHIVNQDSVKAMIIRPRPVLANRAKTASATEIVLCKGDAYTLDTNGNARHAGPNDTVFGIVAAIKLAPISSVFAGQGPLSQEMLLATDAGEIEGMEDSRVDLEVQTDTFAATNRGGLFNLTDALFSSLLRQSRQSLSIGGGAGAQFRAVDIVQRPTDSALGANARIVCRLAQAL